MKKRFIFTLLCFALTSCGVSSSSGSDLWYSSVVPSSQNISSVIESSKQDSQLSSSTCSGVVSSRSEESSLFVTSSKITLQEKLLNLIGSFSYESSLGYTYSLKQFYKSSLTNEHLIDLDLVFDDNVTGTKTEIERKLNNNFDGDMYSTTTVTSYFRDNLIGEQSESNIVWRDGTIEQFYYFDIASYTKFEFLTNPSIEYDGDNIKFVFSIDDEVARSALDNDKISELLIIIFY